MLFWHRVVSDQKQGNFEEKNKQQQQRFEASEPTSAVNCIFILYEIPRQGKGKQLHCVSCQVIGLGPPTWQYLATATTTLTTTKKKHGSNRNSNNNNVSSSLNKFIGKR